MLDSAIQQINHYIQWITIREPNFVIEWIESHPLDSIFHCLNSWGLVVCVFQT